eukprot:9469274-Pyramimonas_sp.AAC.1
MGPMRPMETLGCGNLKIKDPKVSASEKIYTLYLKKQYASKIRAFCGAKRSVFGCHLRVYETAVRVYAAGPQRQTPERKKERKSLKPCDMCSLRITDLLIS